MGKGDVNIIGRLIISILCFSLIGKGLSDSWWFWNWHWIGITIFFILLIFVVLIALEEDMEETINKNRNK